MRAKAGPLALVAVVACAVGAFVMGRTVLRGDPPCAALSAPVDGLGGYRWDNGLTSSGPEWISVLTDGTTEADAPSRAAIASAVDADADGFDRFRAALPDVLRPVADRQVARASDADVDRSGPQVEADARALARHGALACNLA